MEQIKQGIMLKGRAFLKWRHCPMIYEVKPWQRRICYYYLALRSMEK